MYGIKINNQFLNLKKDSTLTYEVNSPLNFGVDVETLANGLLYSLSIPNDNHNAVALGHPFDMQRRGGFIEEQICEILADSVPIFFGYLSVTNATERDIQISIKINTIPNSANTQLSVVLPSVYAFTGGVADMNDCAANPDNYPFIFFPVFNSEILGSWTEPTSIYVNTITLNLQNSYDIPRATFTLVGPFTPFLKINYLFERIALYFGFNVNNEWQTTDELKNLTIYNNFDGAEDLAANNINLQNHCPTITIADFLRKVCRLFNVIYQVDILTKTINIRSVKDILRTSAGKDWTDKCVSDSFVVKRQRQNITQIRYENPYKWTGKSGWYYDTYDTAIQVDDTDALTGSDPLGFYYDKKRKGGYVWTGGTPVLSLTNKPLDQIKYAEGTAWESSLIPAINHVIEVGDPDAAEPTAHTIYAPWVRVLMSTPTNKNDMPFMVLPYRGIREVLEVETPQYSCPFAGADVWDVRRTKNTADALSLYFNGFYGLGSAVSYLTTLNWINTATMVETDLILSAKDLQDIKYYEKIRIGNMEYFVKKIMGIIGNKSISRVKAELVSVI